jgi:hypothetical protein
MLYSLFALPAGWSKFHYYAQAFQASLTLNVLLYQCLHIMLVMYSEAICSLLVDIIHVQ